MTEQRTVTLTYVIGDGEEQNLDFLEQESGDWQCVLDESEINRMIRAAAGNVQI